MMFGSSAAYIIYIHTYTHTHTHTHTNTHIHTHAHTYTHTHTHTDTHTHTHTHTHTMEHLGERWQHRSHNPRLPCSTVSNVSALVSNTYTHTDQKRPAIEAKETYYRGKRDLLQFQTSAP